MNDNENPLEVPPPPVSPIEEPSVKDSKLPFWKRRSVERFVRTMGGILTAAFAPQLPVLLDLVTATIPPQYTVWAGPLISAGMKELRMRYPNNAFIKYLPV